MLALVLCMFYLKSQAEPDVLMEGLAMCPRDWVYRDGSCYRAYNPEKSWKKALEYCREKEGELVSINSAGEQQFVYQNMAVNKTLWIGLVKDRGLGIFRWSNGQRLTFTNWIEKPNIPGHEDCGEMTDYSVFHGQWNDKTCSKKLPFICEKGALIGRYFKQLTGKQLDNHVISHVTTTSSDLECLLWCQRHMNCLSVNYLQDLQQNRVCELSNASEVGFPHDLIDNKDFSYFECVELT